MQLICVLIMIGISLIGFGIELSRHGQDKTGQHNAFFYLIGLIITGLLYWGAGLFDIFQR